MSEKGSYDDLLIDFNNISVEPTEDESRRQSVSIESIQNDSPPMKATQEPMALFCSTEPLYKLLNAESNVVDDNNPFDRLDNRAYLSDDPFEIVANAALIGQVDAVADNDVKTGTLISLESPVVSSTSTGKNIYSKTLCDTPKSVPALNESRTAVLSGTKCDNSVQYTSHQFPNSKDVSPISPIASPSPKSRGKTKNSSFSLLKYTLSNSRLDTADGEILIGDESQQKKHKFGSRRNSTTDDSFDDIWATIPNLIDSQTDLDVDSDIDPDIAKLNIPMLNASMPGSKNGSNGDDGDLEDIVDTKTVSRNELLEKFASIKQKKPQSPMQIENTIAPIHNQTVNIKCSQLKEIPDDEPVTPKSQYSTVVVPDGSDNPNSLIENLKKLVDQCDDKSKQTTAKHLLEDLSSILTTGNSNDSGGRSRIGLEKRAPQPIQRQGTFSLEKSSICNESKMSDESCSRDGMDNNSDAMDPGLSQMVKQIQNAFGSHQNINVLQANDPPMGVATASTINPTYIVVMAQSMADFADENIPQRCRSQSLSLKDKPASTSRAIQHKMESSQAQTTLSSTPIKRPVLQRRSSFGTINRTLPTNSENESKKQTVPDLSKIIRRRSLQGPAAKPVEPEPVAVKRLNAVNRRRSFQGPSTASGIRSPSPKQSSNLNRSITSLRQSTTSTLTRRKSFTNELSRDSPTKLKSSYGIMKKPPAPPATRNLKIRVSQSVGGRSAPLRAVVPMNRVASHLLNNDTVCPLENNKSTVPITSTPRSIPSPSKFKIGSLSGSNIPESPIQNLRNDSYLSMTPTKTTAAATNNFVTNRRKSLSDHRGNVNSGAVSECNSGSTAVSNIKNATKTLATGLSKFTAKRISSIGLIRPSSTGSKENKHPL